MRYLAIFCLLAAALPGMSQSADEIIAKHIAAKGGDAWSKTNTMKVTGTFTGFSIPGPFVMYKTKPDKQYLDHMLGDKAVEMGFDGETAWWKNGWFGLDYHIEVAGADNKAVRFNAEFATPFFDYKARGFSVAYEGIKDLDGIKAHVLKLTRSDESEETWFLDLETFLETECHSDGGDFGRPVAMKTYFSDFRAVDGMQIPHLVEWEFGTRYRVMEVGDVQVNAQVPVNRYAMPLNDGMERLRTLAGTWRLEGQMSGRGGDMRTVMQGERSVIEAEFHGSVLDETLKQPSGMGPQTILRRWSYDSEKKIFRIAVVGANQGRMRILEGPLPEDGPIVVSDLNTDPDAEQNARWSIENISKDGFTMTREASSDKGETWNKLAVLTYRSEAAWEAYVEEQKKAREESE